MLQILCHLQADEASAHDYGTLHLMLRHIGLYAVCITHVSEGEDALAVNTFKRRHNRRCSGRKQQFVVALNVFFAVSGMHGHLLCFDINGCHFAQYAHIDIEPLAESLRRLHKQAVAVFYHPSYIVRQTTIGV